MSLRGYLYRKMMERRAKHEKELKHQAAEDRRTQSAVLKHHAAEDRREIREQTSRDRGLAAGNAEFLRRPSFMMRAIGDMLTKIGCGMLGGGIVIYFFSKSVGKVVGTSTYYEFIAVAAVFFMAGYFLMWRGERH